MKKAFCVAAGFAVAATGVFAQERDSMRMIDMESVQVTSTRAGEKTPIAYTNVLKEEIKAQNWGQDLPFLLQMVPSVVVTSDAGSGIGYTSIRIRGTDPTRINVTSNGIPMNDAESHGLFWVNTPDIAGSAADIQVQRGVGTSTNGAGAFGGSINLRTETTPAEPYAEVSGSYGSYDTHKASIKLGTGLIGGRWSFGGRLTTIHSDGYVNRASTDLKSYFVQGGYAYGGTSVRVLVFGGRERTYHAWDGIAKDSLETNRRYNPSGEILNDAGDIVGYYKDQTDNYRLNNYQAFLTQRLGDNLFLNLAFHYYKGDGYYEQYKNGEVLARYALKPFDKVVDGQTVTVEESNLVRRKIMDNYFTGGIFSLDYDKGPLRVSLGGAANIYDGKHYGRVMWVKDYAGDDMFTAEHEYYRNKGTKKDANIYLKANWEVASGFSLFGDVQYRHINYTIKGTNDKWDKAAGAMQHIDVDNNYDFFNPKAGIFWQANDMLDVYASVAVANREPTRNNFTDAETDVAPKPERLIDYEAGVTYRGRSVWTGANLYYMDYKDQLVLTGGVNHIGEPLTANVEKSFRAGIELSAGVRITHWLSWGVNATLSRNRIKDYVELVEAYDSGQKDIPQKSIEHGDTDISFSPNITAASNITFTYKGFTATVQSNFVGRQYLTNYASALGKGDYVQEEGKADQNLQLDSYFVNTLRLAYDLNVKYTKGLTLGVTVNNIFGAKYCSNGGAGSYVVENPDAPAGYDRNNYSWYFPQATANVVVSATVRF